MSQPLKVTFGTTKRRFTVERSITYPAFCERLTALFALPQDEHLSITYTDPDRDIIAVSSEEELREMFRVTTTSTLLLNLHTESTPAPPTSQHEHATRAGDAAREHATRAGDAAREHAARAADAARDHAARAAEHASRSAEHAREQGARAGEYAQASIESALSCLGAFLSGFGQPGYGPGFGPAPPFGPPGFRPGFGRRRRRQDFAAFAPFMAAFAPLAAAFHRGAQDGTRGGAQGMYDVSEATCSAFRQLRDAVVAAENREEILRSARDVFPAVRQWAMDNISGEMNDDNIGQLCSTVTEIIQPISGERIAGLITDMIRAGLNDPAVVSILRHIPWQAAYDFEAEMDGRRGHHGHHGRSGHHGHHGRSGHHGHHGRRGGAHGGRFDVHRNVECDSCGKAPIEGSRYMATNRSNYDICSDCFNNDDVSKEGLEFKEYKNVWEASYPDAVVPPSPIGFGDRGPAVAFLQKILTDLGYMNASMYRWRVGYYGPNTRSAVEQFQREYGLESVAEIGQYDATTAASLTSVIEAQVPPTAATGGASASDSAAGGAAPGQPKPDAPEPEPAQG